MTSYARPLFSGGRAFFRRPLLFRRTVLLRPPFPGFPRGTRRRFPAPGIVRPPCGRFFISGRVPFAPPRTRQTHPNDPPPAGSAPPRRGRRGGVGAPDEPPAFPLCGIDTLTLHPPSVSQRIGARPVSLREEGSSSGFLSLSAISFGLDYHYRLYMISFILFFFLYFCVFSWDKETAASFPRYSSRVSPAPSISSAASFPT